jgi:hypothetical protein
VEPRVDVDVAVPLVALQPDVEVGAGDAEPLV